MIGLLYGAGSPYARVVRIAIRLRGIEGIAETTATLRDPASAILPHNPVGRVPTLVLADGTALTETLLILAHLDTLHAGARLLPADPAGLAALGQAIGMLDGIAVWHRELRRPEHERSPGVLALEATRAGRVADRLEAGALAGYGDAAGTPALMLTCGLDYVDRRLPAWPWRPGRPRLAAWCDAMAGQAVFRATLPPV
jgi:glutathione S-transferase